MYTVRRVINTYGTVKTQYVHVGSYGTRNIVVIGMMVLGATDRLIVLSLSKF
jgi:hypothetical protein